MIKSDKCDSFNRAKDKFKPSQDYRDKLKIEYNFSDKKIASIIESAMVANLYIQVKGVREAKLIGFSNKKEIRKFILDNSENFNWVFKNTQNERSFLRKIREFKIQYEKSEYLGLKTFISKGINNNNSRKITDEQIEFLQKIKLENPKFSSPNIYKILKEKYPDIKISASGIKNYIREIEVNDFKNKIHLNTD